MSQQAAYSVWTRLFHVIRFEKEFVPLCTISSTFRVAQIRIITIQYLNWVVMLVLIIAAVTHINCGILNIRFHSLIRKRQHKNDSSFIKSSEYATSGKQLEIVIKMPEAYPSPTEPRFAKNCFSS
jgi:hypothetical protein